MARRQKCHIFIKIVLIKKYLRLKFVFL